MNSRPQSEKGTAPVSRALPAYMNPGTIQARNLIPDSGTPQNLSFTRMLGAWQAYSAGTEMISKIQGPRIAAPNSSSQITRKTFLCLLIQDTLRLL